jgi:hypothetical protein
MTPTWGESRSRKRKYRWYIHIKDTYVVCKYVKKTLFGVGFIVHTPTSGEKGPVFKVRARRYHNNRHNYTPYTHIYSYDAYIMT